MGSSKLRAYALLICIAGATANTVGPWCFGQGCVSSVTCPTGTYMYSCEAEGRTAEQYGLGSYMDVAKTCWAFGKTGNMVRATARCAVGTRGTSSATSAKTTGVASVSCPLGKRATSCSCYSASGNCGATSYFRPDAAGTCRYNCNGSGQNKCQVYAVCHETTGTWSNFRSTCADENGLELSLTAAPTSGQSSQAACRASCGSDCNAVVWYDQPRDQYSCYHVKNSAGIASQGYNQCSMTQGDWARVTPAMINNENLCAATKSTTTDSAGGVRIAVTASSSGCSSAGSSHYITHPSGYWSHVMYKQTFQGAASCWGLWGEIRGSSCASNRNAQGRFGLHKFDRNIDTMNNRVGLGTSWWSLARCDNQFSVNWWHSGNGYHTRSANVTLRRISATPAALSTDVACMGGGTKWIFSDIFVRLSCPPATCMVKPDTCTPGTVTSLGVAGNPAGDRPIDGPLSVARFTDCRSITMTHRRNLYAACYPASYFHGIRKIDLRMGDVTTLAGADTGYEDGSPKNARFRNPQHITYNRVYDRLYVVESYNNVIREVAVSKTLFGTPGTTKTLAGVQGVHASNVDGPFSSAKFKPTYYAMGTWKNYIYLSVATRTMRSLDLRTRQVTTLFTSSGKETSAMVVASNAIWLFLNDAYTSTRGALGYHTVDSHSKANSVYTYKCATCTCPACTYFVNRKANTKHLVSTGTSGCSTCGFDLCGANVVKQVSKGEDRRYQLGASFACSMLFPHTRAFGDSRSAVNFALVDGPSQVAVFSKTVGAEYYNGRFAALGIAGDVRIIDWAKKTSSTIAGKAWDNLADKDGPFSSARFMSPRDTAVDMYNGDLYVVNAGKHGIRRLCSAMDVSGWVVEEDCTPNCRVANPQAAFCPTWTPFSHQNMCKMFKRFDSINP